MAHPKKGSPAAKAWGAKMQAARKKAGYRRGPNKRMKKNPLYFVQSKAKNIREFAQTWLLSPVTPIGEAKMVNGRELFGMKDKAGKKIYVGYDEQRKEFVVLDSTPRENPGETWHNKEAGYAHEYVRKSHDSDEKVFYAGVESAHRISASAAHKLKMNPKKERVILPRHRKNPLAVFGVGNPPKQISASVAGVLYSRCLEIRAEKVKYKPGLYKHPFTRSVGVQILALDSGDLLVHSTRKVNLWKPV